MLILLSIVKIINQLEFKIKGNTHLECEESRQFRIYQQSYDNANWNKLTKSGK